MFTLNPADLKTVDLQNYLQHAIAPRPICFASTMDEAGNVNLSPFSFFNMMGANPPICVFSPSRRVRDNTIKHTLENLMEVPECVINIVNYSIVQQTSLASTEYKKGVNEFRKGGFTELKSEMVRPPRVAESPVQLECLVKDIISLGDAPGAGNLVITEVKLIHISEEVLDENKKIDQAKMDLVARLGGDWYCRVSAQNLFKVPKPLTTLGIGVDALPFHARNSKILSGNDLGKLGNMELIPSLSELELLKHDKTIVELLSNLESEKGLEKLHLKAKELINKEQIYEALKIVFLKN
jgi:flavin reductase (DIM6/NTAB) family NADH-FMN oxidoreductase RutF